MPPPEKQAPMASQTVSVKIEADGSQQAGGPLQEATPDPEKQKDLTPRARKRKLSQLRYRLTDKSDKEGFHEPLES